MADDLFRELGRGCSFTAAMRGGKEFLRIQYRTWIHAVVQPLHDGKIILTEHLPHQLIFFHAYTVLAGNAAAYGNAVNDNVVGSLYSAPLVIGIARVKTNDGMQIAIASVQDIPDS